MYEIVCDDCGRIGAHPSGIGAETRAEGHHRRTDHPTRVVAMR